MPPVLPSLDYFLYLLIEVGFAAPFPKLSVYCFYKTETKNFCKGHDSHPDSSPTAGFCLSGKHPQTDRVWESWFRENVNWEVVSRRDNATGISNPGGSWMIKSSKQEAEFCWTSWAPTMRDLLDIWKSKAALAGVQEPESRKEGEKQAQNNGLCKNRLQHPQRSAQKKSQERPWREGGPKKSVSCWRVIQVKEGSMPSNTKGDKNAWSPAWVNKLFLAKLKDKKEANTG